MMPNVGVIDLSSDEPGPIESFFTKLGKDYRDKQDQLEINKLLGEYQQNREDANAWENLQLGLEKSTISPTKRIETQQRLNEMQKVIIEKDKSLNAKVKQMETEKANESIIRDMEKRYNLPKGTLDPYLNDPKLAEKILNSPKGTLSERPIDPEQLRIIKEVRDSEGFDELDELGQYQRFTEAGVSRANAETESKLKGEQLKRLQTKIEKSYEAQKDFINETTNSYKAFETEMKPRLLQMQNIPSDELIGPTAAVFLEQLGIPLGALENPSSELYSKLSQDLLKGLPETYGNRILKVEVENFLKTIPQLVNSANGRRMIASNILKLGEMKEVYYNEMRRQQKEIENKNKSYPRDFQQEVFDQVKPQIDRINDEFVKLSEITDVPEGEVPFFDPEGNIVFVPKQDQQWAIENGGRRIW